MRTLRMGIGLSACVFLLAACGGGGGGNRSGSGSGSGGGGPITPTANVTVAITSPAINGSISQGDSFSATISGTWSATNLGGGSVYLQVSDSANTFTLPAVQAAPANNAFSYSLPMVAGLASGERSGTLTVRACKDASCNSTYNGNSGSVAYRLSISQIPDWETLQGNAAHNGYVPITLDPAKFVKSWEWTAPTATGMNTSYVRDFVTGSNGVYPVVMSFHSSGSEILHDLVALDEANGGLRWKKRFEPDTYGAYITGAAHKSGKLYVGVGNAPYGLASVDATNGASLFASTAVSGAASTMPPTIFDNDVFAQGSYDADGRSELAAADTSTGNRRWGFAVNAGMLYRPTLTPAVDADHVYFHSKCCIEVLDRRTGSVAASIPTPHPQYAGSDVLSDAIFLGSRGNVITSFRAYLTDRVLASYNIATGTREWVIPFPYTPYPATANGVIYATRINDAGPTLHALNEMTGQILWEWNPPAGETNTNILGNVLVTKNLVLFSTGNGRANTGKLWAVDVNTHQTVWSYPAGGSIAISSNLTLYLAPELPFTEEGRLISFKLR